jgi:hypothetical protein
MRVAEFTAATQAGRAASGFKSAKLLTAKIAKKIREGRKEEQNFKRFSLRTSRIFFASLAVKSF